MRKKMKIFICNNQRILTQIFEKLKAVWLGNVLLPQLFEPEIYYGMD